MLRNVTCCGFYSRFHTRDAFRVLLKGVQPWNTEPPQPTERAEPVEPRQKRFFSRNNARLLLL